METFELIEQLSKKSKVEIEYALLSLMIDNKIDFVSLNNAYVKYLEMKTDDMKSKLTDANCCTLSLLSNFKKETKANHPEIHWALYNLNESGQFNMQGLNKKFGYDKETDCKYSSYWREKKK